MPYLNMNCMKIIENLKMQYILLNPVEKSNFGSKKYSKKMRLPWTQYSIPYKDTRIEQTILSSDVLYSLNQLPTVAEEA